MKIYKANHNYFIKQRNIFLITYVFIVIILFVMEKYIMQFKKTDNDYSLKTTIISTFILIFISIFTFITEYIKLKKTCASFQIEMSDDCIKVTKSSSPSYRIFRNTIITNIIKCSEIESITEIVNNRIIIITSTKNSCISIPVDLYDYDDFKDNLQKIKQITTTNKQVSPLISISVFFAFGIVFFFRTPFIVLPLSIALIVLFIWCIIKITKNSNVKIKTKITFLIFIFIPIFLLLLKIYYTTKYFI